MKEFRIPQKIPKQPTSTNKSIASPTISSTRWRRPFKAPTAPFPAFVIEAVRVALENLREQNAEQ